MDLHMQIMNIQTGNTRKILEKYFIYPEDDDVRKMVELAYKIGHKDARHAAAELVIMNENKGP